MLILFIYSCSCECNNLWEFDKIWHNGSNGQPNGDNRMGNDGQKEVLCI